MTERTTFELDKVFAERIKAECMSGDNENDHMQADSVLLELLSTLGFHATVAAWDDVGRWYA